MTTVKVPRREGNFFLIFWGGFQNSPWISVLAGEKTPMFQRGEPCRGESGRWLNWQSSTGTRTYSSQSSPIKWDVVRTRCPAWPAGGVKSRSFPSKGGRNQEQRKAHR